MAIRLAINGARPRKLRGFAGQQGGFAICTVRVSEELIGYLSSLVCTVPFRSVSPPTINESIPSVSDSSPLAAILGAFAAVGAAFATFFGDEAAAEGGQARRGGRYYMIPGGDGGWDGLTRRRGSRCSSSRGR